MTIPALRFRGMNVQLRGLVESQPSRIMRIKIFKAKKRDPAQRSTWHDSHDTHIGPAILKTRTGYGPDSIDTAAYSTSTKCKLLTTPNKRGQWTYHLIILQNSVHERLVMAQD